MEVFFLNFILKHNIYKLIKLYFTFSDPLLYIFSKYNTIKNKTPELDKKTNNKRISSQYLGKKETNKLFEPIKRGN